MRKGWIALFVCGGVALGFSLANVTQSQAAMLIKPSTKSMSLVEEAKKKRAKKR